MIDIAGTSSEMEGYWFFVFTGDGIGCTIEKRFTEWIVTNGTMTIGPQRFV